MIKTFHNTMFGNLRTVTRDGEPWFVAADVCRVLEIGNSRQALTRLNDDEKGVISTDTPGGKQNMSVVNEPGLYQLVLGSRKPEAKAFARWLTHEVIPALRKDGIYATAELMADRERLVEQVGALLAANDRLEKRNDELFGGYHDAVREAERSERILSRYRMQEDADGLCDLRTTAGNLCMSEHEFINRCLQRRLLYRGARGRLRVYARPFARCMFVMKGNRVFTDAKCRERLAIALNV